jgi:hypothetical protein
MTPRQCQMSMGERLGASARAGRALPVTVTPTLLVRHSRLHQRGLPLRRARCSAQRASVAACADLADRPAIKPLGLTMTPAGVVMMRRFFSFFLRTTAAEALTVSAAVDTGSSIPRCHAWTSAVYRPWPPLPP